MADDRPRLAERLQALADPFAAGEADAPVRRTGSEALFELPPLPAEDQAPAADTAGPEATPTPIEKEPEPCPAPVDQAIFRLPDGLSPLGPDGLASPILDRPQDIDRPAERAATVSSGFSFDGDQAPPLFGIGVADDFSRAPFFRDETATEESAEPEPENAASAPPLPRPLPPPPPRERLTRRSRRSERRRAQPPPTAAASAAPPSEEPWDGLDATIPIAGSTMGNDEQWDGLDLTIPISSSTTADAEEQWDGLDATIPISGSTTAGEEQWDGLDATIPIQGGAPTPGPEDDWLGLDLTIPTRPASEADSQTGRTSDDGQQTDVTLAAADPGSQVTAHDPGTHATRLHREATDATNATMVTGDGEATSHTLIPGQGERRGRGATSVAFDAAWHMAGRKGPATGQVWGDYEIGGVLGEGGMGLVYRARQLSLERKCAVKVLASHLAADENLRERFELEARATSILRSANIVAVYTAGNIAGQPYFVMEFVDGTDLGDEIKRRNKEGKRFSVDETIDIVLQAARGLAEAGSHHIVHRDIKPSNLMFTKAKVIKLTDFGIVKIKGESQLTLTGQAMGTPAYVSPEQGRGEEVDERSDLYSLGVVLYELLTMQKPFTGGSPDALIYQHSYDEPTLPKEIDPSIGDDIQAVVIKLMAKKPENRYQSARELVRDLEDINEGKRLEKLLAQGKLSTGGAEALRENQTWIQRHGIFAMSSIAAVAILVVGGLVWWLQVQSERQQAAESAREQVASLRSSLAVLDAQAGLYEGIETDLANLRQTLATYPVLGSADDRERFTRWREKIDRIGRLRETLADLGPQRQPTYDQLQTWHDAYARLRSDVGPEARGIESWGQALLAIDARITQLADGLLALETVPDRELTVAAREENHALRDRLAGMVAPDDPRLQRIDERLQAHVDFVAVLGERLDSDLTRDPTDDSIERYQRISDDLAVAAAILPPTSERLAAWRAGLLPVLHEWRRAARNIARLDGTPAPRDIPAAGLKGLRADVERLASLGAFGQRQHRGLLERIDAIAAYWTSIERARQERKPRLAGLDRPEPISQEQRAVLAELEDILDGIVDDDVQRWRSKVNTVDRLSTALADLPKRFVVDDLTDRFRTLKQLQGLVGEDDPAVATSAERLELLYGPSPPAWAAEHGRDRFGPWAVLRLDADHALRFRYVMPGQARIGSPESEPGREVDEEQIELHIPHAFWIADTECTRAFYAALTGLDPSRHSSREPSMQRPVDRVSRADIADFIATLRERLGPIPMRLPSEFEWEYACRAGGSNAYSVLRDRADAGEGTVSLEAFAWYRVNSKACSRPVGKLRPNPLGLFDMHGNLWEWCDSPYGPYSVEGLSAMQQDVDDRWVARGGSWGDGAQALRAANRLAVRGRLRSAYLGFRPVIDTHWPQPPDGTRILTRAEPPSDIIAAPPSRESIAEDETVDEGGDETDDTGAP